MPEKWEATPGGRSMAWLADAPLFIDADQVSALYNAVVKPENQTGKITLSFKDTKSFSLEGKVSAEAEVGVAAWLKTLFPFLDAKAKLAIEAAPAAGLEKEKGREIELLPIDTPQRQLVQLALHYFINLPHRVRAVTNFSETDWLEDGFISTLPRGLVFVDCAPRTKFLPMAAEIEKGNVQPIYGDLVKAFVGPSESIRVPDDPEPALFEGKQDELILKRQEYWKFFDDHFRSKLAMEAVERKVSAANGLIRWIDYRVPLGAGLPCLHLSVSPQGRYDTGTFAYRLVKRGYKHGLRIVGTMKSEPAMNVLAIFER